MAGGDRDSLCSTVQGGSDMQAAFPSYLGSGLPNAVDTGDRELWLLAAILLHSGAMTEPVTGCAMGQELRPPVRLQFYMEGVGKEPRHQPFP